MRGALFWKLTCNSSDFVRSINSNLFIHLFRINHFSFPIHSIHWHRQTFDVLKKNHFTCSMNFHFWFFHWSAHSTTANNTHMILLYYTIINNVRQLHGYIILSMNDKSPESEFITHNFKSRKQCNSRSSNLSPWRSEPSNVRNDV